MYSQALFVRAVSLPVKIFFLINVILGIHLALGFYPDHSNTASASDDQFADLSLSKIGFPQALFPGETLTYTLGVMNSGPSLAEQVTMIDELPLHVSLVAVTTTQGDCQGTAVITCNLENLSEGATSIITITVAVDPLLIPDKIINRAKLESSTPDPDLSNNEAIVETDILPFIADLQVTLTDDPDPVLPGSILTYNTSIYNLGPSTANQVELVVTLPAQVTFQSYAPAETICNSIGGTITCNLGDFISGQTEEMIFETRVAAGVVGQLGTQARVSSQTQDPDEQNNLALEITTVEAASPDPPDLGLVWVQPVASEEIYFVSGEILNLRVEVDPNAGVAMVYFERWDVNAGEEGDRVSLGYVFEDPYELEIDTSLLHFGFNEIRAWAFDAAQSNPQMAFIWLFRVYPVYLPLIVR